VEKGDVRVWFGELTGAKNGKDGGERNREAVGVMFRGALEQEGSLDAQRKEEQRLKKKTGEKKGNFKKRVAKSGGKKRLGWSKGNIRVVKGGGKRDANKEPGSEASKQLSASKGWDHGKKKQECGVTVEKRQKGLAQMKKTGGGKKNLVGTIKTKRRRRVHGTSEKLSQSNRVEKKRECRKRGS